MRKRSLASWKIVQIRRERDEDPKGSESPRSDCRGSRSARPFRRPQLCGYAAVPSSPPPSSPALLSVSSAHLGGIAPVIAADDLLARRLLSFEGGHPLAEAQHDDPIGHLEDVLEVVADHDDAEALARRGASPGRAPGPSAGPRARRSARRRAPPSARRPGSGRSPPTAAGRPRGCRPRSARCRAWSPRARRGARLERCSMSISSSTWKREPPSPTSSLPRKRFATTSRLSQSARSWKTVAIPSLLGCLGIGDLDLLAPRSRPLRSPAAGLRRSP